MSDREGLRRRRERLRGWLLVAVGVLFALSIPWYRDAEEPVSLWFGLPDWVAVALVCYAGAALLNAAAWSVTDLGDGEADDDP